MEYHTEGHQLVATTVSICRFATESLADLTVAKAYDGD